MSLSVGNCFIQRLWRHGPGRRPLRRIDSMNTLLRSALATGLLISSGWTCAQVTAPAPAAPATLAAVKTVSQDLRVVEDDNVRIEETRARGQLQRIVVHTRLGGAGSYEIIVGSPGRDLSKDRGAVGQRAWSLLAF